MRATIAKRVDVDGHICGFSAGEDEIRLGTSRTVCSMLMRTIPEKGLRDLRCSTTSRASRDVLQVNAKDAWVGTNHDSPQSRHVSFPP